MMARGNLVHGALVLLLLAVVPRASATDCFPGCLAQKAACIKAGRTTAVACKVKCAQGAPADRAACVASCVGALVDAKAACLGDRTTCMTSCMPPSLPPCGATCGQQLATCAHQVLTDAITCAHGCAGAADRPGCLGTCATTARAGATHCAADFNSCISGCRPPTSTTLPFPHCGVDPASGTCGGPCPFGLTCQAPPPGSGIPVPCLCQPAGQPCTTSSECQDGNPCTADVCALGHCVHPCLCLGSGGLTCCPGPAGSCGSPSGAFVEG